MKAWVVAQPRNGFDKALQMSQVEKPPAPKKGQVLIKVAAMGVNPADYKIISRYPTLATLAFGSRSVPGLDFCGRIAQLPASGAPADLKVGQLVFGRLDLPGKYGPLAEYALAPIAGLAPVPSGLTADKAAGIGTAAVTAYQSIVPYVQAGSTVFINGGSGGTGVYAIQIAKLLGCHVVTSCSAANADLCRSLGADEVIDYRSEDIGENLAARGQVFDLVADLVGHRVQLHAESAKFLKPTGLFVLVAGMDDSWGGICTMLSSWLRPAWLGGVPRKWKMMLASNRRPEVLQIAKWVEEGKIQPVVDSEFAFEDAKEAYAKLQAGRAKGKIIIWVEDKRGAD